MPLHSIKINDSYKPKLSLIDRFDMWLTYNAPFHSFWRWEIKGRYYKVRDYFFPRQSWVMGGLPKSWMDKDAVITQVLFNCVIHFIEKEEALTTVDWAGSFPEGEKFCEELIACYNWAKSGHAQMEEKMSAAYPPTRSFEEMFVKLPNGNSQYISSEKSYEEEYGEVNKIEKELDETDEKWLTWIIQNRKYLWV
jgi:hypothetical protein